MCAKRWHFQKVATFHKGYNGHINFKSLLRIHSKLRHITLVLTSARDIKELCNVNMDV